jgi:AI-2 transport protein TqsA
MTLLLQITTIKKLLIVIVAVLVIYLLKTLFFIFVPLVGALFLALLFMPLMRWLYRHKINKYISVSIAILLVVISVRLGWEIIKLSGHEIMSQKDEVFMRIESKLDTYLYLAENFLGLEKEYLHEVVENNDIPAMLMESAGEYLSFLSNTVSMMLMTVFFLVLLLIGTLNIPHMMQNTLFATKHSSVKTFIKIEKSIVKFMEVKFFMSLFTGIGFGLACYFFDVSFPIFWGLFAFAVNFIQMIGSFVSTALVSLFALAEIEPTGTLMAFILTAIGVQVIFGSIMEPILMGKSFSINTITILVMLMFWGYIWGVPGMILSIPITVLIKIVMDQFQSSKTIADLMS